jgi:hypothetical protein
MNVLHERPHVIKSKNDNLFLVLRGTMDKTLTMYLHSADIWFSGRIYD